MVSGATRRAVSFGFVPSHTFVEDRFLLSPVLEAQRVQLGTRAMDDLRDPERMSLVLVTNFFTQSSGALVRLRSLRGVRDGVRLMIAEFDDAPEVRTLLAPWAVKTELELHAEHTPLSLISLELMRVGDDVAMHALLSSWAPRSAELRRLADGIRHCFLEPLEVVDWERLRVP